MAAAVCAFILTFTTILGPSVVSGVLSTPTNVRLTSNNMNLMLTWDSTDRPASSQVYTTQFKSSVSDYKVGCVNISNLECDLSQLNVSIFEYGKYTGRVRSQSGTESSTWEESNQITLDKDTIIGSPIVSLSSNGAAIEVTIKDPVFTISALRKVYHSVNYNITYWEDGWREKARSNSNIQQNRLVLNDLDPWTKYCVQVQIITERNPNLSKPSAAVCESTTTEEEVPWVAAVGTFCIVAMAVALVVVAVVYRKHMSHFLCPKDALPQHLKEYLLAPPISSMYLAMRNSHPPDEIYHQVSIIADARPTTGGSKENLQQTA